MYSEDIVQYGSEGPAMILVPVILGLNELIVHLVNLIVVRVFVQFASFFCFSVSDQCVQVRGCAL